MTLTVGIYLFPDVEVLDFAGPYEVFTTASRVALRRTPGREAPFRVITVAAAREPVRARAGLVAMPDHALDDHPPLDVLIIPGGVVDAELDRPEVIRWIAAQATHVSLVASVCTGAFLLARAGLLDGRQATTHWEDLADLRARFPAVRVLDGPRWVDLSGIVTSAGIAAGMDMSLHLVGRIAGSDLAIATARQMDVAWQPDTGVNGTARTDSWPAGQSRQS